MYLNSMLLLIFVLRPIYQFQIGLTFYILEYADYTSRRSLRSLSHWLQWDKSSCKSCHSYHSLSGTLTWGRIVGQTKISWLTVFRSIQRIAHRVTTDTVSLTRLVARNDEKLWNFYNCMNSFWNNKELRTLAYTIESAEQSSGLRLSHWVHRPVAATQSCIDMTLKLETLAITYSELKSKHIKKVF